MICNRIIERKDRREIIRNNGTLRNLALDILPFNGNFHMKKYSNYWPFSHLVKKIFHFTAKEHLT